MVPAAAWPAYCAGPPPLIAPLDHGTLLNPDDHSDLELSTPGLAGNTDGGTPAPTAIAAGSGWHDFQLTASPPVQSANSDLANSPRELKWTAFLSYAPGSPGRPAGEVEYLKDGVWSDLGEWDGVKTTLVTTPLGGGSQTATATVQLRFKIDATPPRGSAYVVEFGSYVDADQSCTHSTFAVNMITVGAPGSGSDTSLSLAYAGIGAVVSIAAGVAIMLVARRRKRS